MYLASALHPVWGSIKKNPNRFPWTYSFFLAQPWVTKVWNYVRCAEVAGSSTRELGLAWLSLSWGPHCPGDLSSSNKREALGSDPSLSRGQRSLWETEVIWDWQYACCARVQVRPSPCGADYCLWLRRVLEEAGVSLDTLPIQRLAICGREKWSATPTQVEGEGYLGPPTNYNSNYSSVSTLSISALGHEGDPLGIE